MKRISIALFLAALTGGLILYVMSHFPPYDFEKLKQINGQSTVDVSVLTDNIDQMIEYGLVLPIIDTKIIGIISLLGFIFIVSLISGLHMLVDKLFYKKFYEEPRTWPALRRGVLIFLMSFGLVFFRLIGGLNFANAFLVIFLCLILEIVAIQFTDKPR
jgi:hypothetical protein